MRAVYKRTRVIGEIEASAPIVHKLGSSDI